MENIQVNNRKPPTKTRMLTEESIKSQRKLHRHMRRPTRFIIQETSENYDPKYVHFIMKICNQEGDIKSVKIQEISPIEDWYVDKPTEA